MGNALALFKFAAIFHPKQAKEMISKKEFNLDECMANDFVKACLCNLGTGIFEELKGDFGCYLERLEKTVRSDAKFPPMNLSLGGRLMVVCADHGLLLLACLHCSSHQKHLWSELLQ